MRTKEITKATFLEIIFVLLFMLLISIIIYFLLRSMNTNEVLVNIKKNNTLDQINSIMSATDNAINKIYNVLVVSTIFFTVLVASVSIFQFIKIKDVDKLKTELSLELKKLKKKFNKKIDSSELKFNNLEEEHTKKISEIETQYKNQSENINRLIEQLEYEISVLNLKSLELEIDTSYIKVKELEKSKAYPFLELRNAYERILQLLTDNPSIKPVKFVFNIYLDLATALIDILEVRSIYAFEDKEYYYIKTLLEKAIQIANNNKFTEYEIVPTYRLFVQLEKLYDENGGNSIFYLEKMFDENVYDYNIAIELANSYDLRNIDNDLEKELEVLETIVTVTKNKEVKQEIFSFKNAGYFKNLLNSKFASEFNKLIDLYSN